MNTEQINKINKINKITQLNADCINGDMVIGLSGERVIGSSILRANQYTLKYVLECIDHIEIVMISAFEGTRDSVKITYEEWEILKHVV